MCGASFAAIALFSYLPLAIPFLQPYAAALIAASFIYLPAFALWRREERFGQIGVVWPARGSYRALLLVIVIVFPLFSAGFFAWHRVVYQRNACLESARLADWPEDLYRNEIEANEELLLYKNDRGTLILRNGTAESERLVVEATPETLLPLPVRARGEILLGPKRSLRLTGNPGPAEVRIVRRSRGQTLRAGFSEVELPHATTRGWHWLLTLIFVQIVLIALPEEVFYRGYLQTRLQQLIRIRWTLWGGDVGPAVILTSLCFALGHLIAIPSAHRLAVFFPSLLFGWLRSRTGSVIAPIILHALSNVLLQVLQRFLCAM